MKNVKFVDLGIPGIQEFLRNGIPTESSILVAGNPGVGKTTLGAQFIYRGLELGEPGIYIGFIETENEFLRHMRGLGLNFD